jgi:hypothetical protein
MLHDDLLTLYVILLIFYDEYLLLFILDHNLFCHHGNEHQLFFLNDHLKLYDESHFYQVLHFILYDGYLSHFILNDDLHPLFVHVQSQ